MNSTKDRLSSTENNIKVFCRLRPLNDSEKRTNSKFIVNYPANHNGNYIGLGGKWYFFDKVFQPNATQEQVYNEAAKSIVTDVLAGYNGTIFAYGQTASGKTHTMEGEIGDANDQGIIPRIGFDIFNHICGMEETYEFEIKVSYFEIYMNKIRDLLDVARVNLGVHEDRNGVPFVRGTTERFVSSPEEIYATIQEGRSNRQIAITSMNEHSSRSHSIFMISIKGRNTENQRIQSSKLYLVDLAGFEKVAKTGAEGTTLDEAKNINKSLSALRNVISALTETNKSHIPYRDSILTRILQESLGGNTKTTIIVCCSPGSSNESETKSALQFGDRLKAIHNFATVNEELSIEECERCYKHERKRDAKLRSIIEKLKLELSRWRQGEIITHEEQIKLDLELGMITPISGTLGDNDRSVLNSPDKEFLLRLLSNGDRKKLKEEREQFYQQVNEKNNVINHQLKYLTELEERVELQKKLIGSVYQKCKQLRQELSFINRHTQSAKGKTIGILQRLDKFTINDDNNSPDIEMEKQKNETVPAIPDGEYHTVLTEGSNAQKVKSELENSISSSHDSGRRDVDCKKKVSECKTKVSEFQFSIPQYNNEYKQIPLTSVGETDPSQFILKTFVTVSCGEQEEEPQLINVKNVFSEITELKESESRLRVALEDQMNQLRNTLERVAALELEIADKQETIDQLSDMNLEYVSAYEQMKADYEQLKQVEAGKSVKLHELTIEHERYDETQNDLKELDDRLTKQLRNLHNLREQFIGHFQNTVDNSLDFGVIEDITDDGDSSLLEQKISYLENNLEQLTKIHIQLLKDNVDFRCVLPELEMKLRASGERVEELERALRKSEDAAKWDRKRYQYIVYSIEEKFKHENSTGRILNEEITESDAEKSKTMRSNDEGCAIS